MNEGTDDFEDKTIYLGADIDLGNQGWTPIGTKTNSFQGTFDGAGKTISNLTIENSELDYAGLFGYLSSPGTIKNVTIQNASVHAQQSVGTLVGDAFTGSVEHCQITGTISVTGHYKLGGMAGEGYANLSDCHVIGESGSAVTATHDDGSLEGDNVGGLIGFKGEGSNTISNCSVSGLTVTGTRKVGGIVGSAFDNNRIVGSTVRNVTVASNADAGYIAANPTSIAIGGIVGLYTENGAHDGTLYGCAVENITLTSGASGVYMGQLIGGIRGTSCVESMPGSPWMQNGNTIDGAAAVFTADELKSAVSGAAEKKVALACDIALSETLTLSGPVTVDGYQNTITCSRQIASGALLDVTGGGVILQNLIVDAGDAVKHGVQFYCVDGGTLRNVAVNGGSYTAVIINGARNITLQDCALSSNGYTNIEYAMGAGVNSAQQIPSFTVDRVTFKEAGESGTPVMIWADDRTAANLKQALGEDTTEEAVRNKIQASIVNRDSTTITAYVNLGTEDNPQIQTIEIGQKQYTVTIAGGGTGAAAGGGQYAQGASVTINAGVKDGYTFSHWTSGDQVTFSNASSPSTTFTMPAWDVTVTANWVQNAPTGGSGSSSNDSNTSGDKTETVTNPDGSTVTTVSKPDGSSTETTKNPDGSQQVVNTDKEGNVTTTVTDTTGNKTETVEKTDGSSQTTVTNTDGSSSTTTVDETGKTQAQVELPDAVVNDAADKGEAVALPMPQVPVTTQRDSAPTVTVSLPGSSTSAKVEIPVEDVTPGTVAVIAKADGTEEVIKTSITTENGVAVTLSDGDTVKIVDNSKAFDDVPGSHWGSEYIDFATSREIFSGTGESTFSPDTAMTRAMIVTVLAAYEGVDTSAGDTWYEAGQQWAVASGVSDGSNMDQSLTREQLATMLWSYAGRPGAGSLAAYPDADSVSDWAAEAVAWAVENGFIAGMDGTLNPQGQATRAQVATILMRFVENNA